MDTGVAEGRRLEEGPFVNAWLLSTELGQPHTFALHARAHESSSGEKRKGLATGGQIDAAILQTSTV